MKKNIISFSLWGDDPSYIEGAKENIRLCRIHYPGWICRFYVAADSAGLLQLPPGPDVEIVIMEPPVTKKHGSLAGYIPWDGIYWRLLPAADPTVGYFISRDCDGRLGAKEAACVHEWIASGKTLHTIHVYAFHQYALHGGLWGSKGGAIPDMQKLIDDWFETHQLRNNTTRESESDEKFLSEIIWPKFKEDYIGHKEDYLIYYNMGSNEKTFPLVGSMDDFKQIKIPKEAKPRPSLLLGKRKADKKPEPLPVPINRRALVLSGHLRDFRNSAPLIRRQFSGDIFIAAWDYLDIDRKDKVDVEEVKEMFNPVAIHIERQDIIRSAYQEKYYHIKEYKEYWCGWHKNRRGWDTYCTFHIMRHANDLKRIHEIDNNFTYDYVVRFRPDYIFRNLPNTIEANTIYFPENSNYNDMTDNLAVGDSPTMDKLFLCGDLIDVCLLKNDCRWMNESILLQHLKNCKIDMKKVPGFTYQNCDGTPPGGDQAELDWKPSDLY